MNDVEKLIAIMVSGVDSPALAYGLSALIFAHDDECPKLADVTAVCNCDPDIYDGLTNQKIEAARPAPAGAEELTIKFQREKVAELLAQCTPKQQELFRKIYPNGVPASALANAYDMCARTIRKNEAAFAAYEAGELRSAPAGAKEEAR